MKGQKILRRDFLRLAAGGTLGVVVAGVPKLLQGLVAKGDAARPAPQASGEEYDWERHYFGFACDSDRCIGCGRCVVACKLENKVPWEAEYNRTWIERYVISEDGEVFADSPNAGRDGFQAEHLNAIYQNLKVRKGLFVPKLCNQCDEPPCVQVCPVGATYMTKDGVVLVDQKHCIGCRYCIQACPYGARFMLPDIGPTIHGENRVVDKCTWCYHRITKGLLPACVEACPVGARTFGDLRDPESTVRKVLREKRTHVLKHELGTKPKVYYVGFEDGVR